MIDRFPNLPRSGDSKAEMPHADGDSLLDPDLESTLRQEGFLAFTNGKKMRQVAERLREEKPDEFDIAEQMAEAIRVSLDEITKIRRRAGGLEKEARDCWRFLTLWRTWLLLRRWGGS